ncbi:MAG: tRNA preQ1(34) S-adenosylmethionine ribosyltransferase-isomerase QueA [Eubacteriales bacterium]
MHETNNIIRNKLMPTALNTEDFAYHLPSELIAQTPAAQRDSSRLLALNRRTGAVTHTVFSDITGYLNKGDVLVINDTRVIPARLYGIKESTGIKIEVLLLRRRGDLIWEVLIRPGRRVKDGTIIIFGDGQLRAEVAGLVDDGCRLLRFDCSGEEMYSMLDRVGSVPLPPYITDRTTDPSRYQTVYARENGSAAAPTAGLHFTPDLLDKLREKGVKIVPVLLHVGLGTFRPVKETKIKDHIMHSEYFEVSEESAGIINSRTGRIIAVGTTSCRTLESAADENGVIHAMRGDTGIFIYPGYRFRATDALITNFHLPESTLLMLVSAFSTREIVMGTYVEAVRERYRFFSYGDAMLLY